MDLRQANPPQRLQEERTELRTLAIIGLHNSQTVRLDFAPQHSVFIADNGAGKTTALFILQCILSNTWKRILRYDFETIQIAFSNGEFFSVPRQEIAEQPTSGWLARLIERGSVSEYELRHLSSLARHTSLEGMRRNELFLRVSRQARMPTTRVYEILVRYSSSFWQQEASLFDETSHREISRLRAFITSNFNHSVIYLPTYRRVEQELRMLLDKEENEEAFGTAIRFGMKDVERRIEALGKEIRDHFVVTYGRISGQMLHQLAREADVSSPMKSRLNVREDIEIVLSRLSDYVSEEDRQHILWLFDEGQLIDNQHLSFFISNLITAYDEVKDIERSIQSFGKKCNQYLLRKEFRYDSSSAALKLYQKGTERDALGLNALSSGEKQIVGVLSQVYLGKDDSYVIIFDEPELSLSVEWQRTILPDIIQSHKCFSLVAATHSPFIFENELDGAARSLAALDYTPPMTHG